MDEKTLFQIFNIPRESFTKDLLKSSYYSIIKNVHPDKMAASAEGREEAAQFINKAYKTLSNDYVRSIYEYSLDNMRNLVKRDLPQGIYGDKKITVLDLEKERIGCNKGLVSTEFLDEILGLEDKIESVHGEELEEVEGLIKKEIEKCAENKKDVKALARWKYYDRLINIILQKKMIE
ncbi:hypothetical protein NEMIN01_0969 [Nematocida minor]|uniref:uncharacterized protein n=1 Tax=Nematocida minor TaxID=1912983 RepID=UPI00221E5816|nr:uncharacterized protein NEMIN01_0969 [Nematocida minor]KAI5190270.1 hypothetical protein NEMIN01_0969 [Nematocida minor]